MNLFGHNGKFMKPRVLPGPKISLSVYVCLGVGVYSKIYFRIRRAARRRSKGNQGLR